MDAGQIPVRFTVDHQDLYHLLGDSALGRRLLSLSLQTGRRARHIRAAYCLATGSGFGLSESVLR
jgi:hypothetical protein